MKTSRNIFKWLAIKKKLIIFIINFKTGFFAGLLRIFKSKITNNYEICTIVYLLNKLEIKRKKDDSIKKIERFTANIQYIKE